MLKPKFRIYLLIATALAIPAACFWTLPNSSAALVPSVTNIYHNFAVNISKSGKTTNTESTALTAKNQEPSKPGNPQPVPANPQNNGNKSTDQQDKPFSEILGEKGITDVGSGLKIMIKKSDHTLSLVYNGESLKSYHVEFGEGGPGDKEVEGDHKTPEGTFYVTDKSVMDPPDQYLGTRWLGVSYPMVEDANRGLQNGLIDQQTHDDIVNAVNNGDEPLQDTALGGNIGIHGGGTPELGSNWTWGCIGLNNSDIEDFYDFIQVGTSIIISQ